MALHRLLASLAPCPICKTRQSSARGCCTVCQRHLFTPSIVHDTLTLGPYQDELGAAVRALKYKHVTALAELLAEQMALELKRTPWHLDGVVAVPLHWQRRLTRGYNQAALVAKPLARKLNVPYLPVLSRVRMTKQQARLSKAERLKNLDGAFNAQDVTRKQLVLVDDVITTGTTIGACREALFRAGARRVYLAAIAGPKTRT